MTDLIELHQHKEFKAKRSAWEGLQVLREGDQQKLRAPRYLWLHEFEANQSGAGVKDTGAKIRAIREERSRYVNLMETAESRWISFLFRGEMTIPQALREIITPEIEADFDGKGNSIKDFMKECFAEPALTLGKVVLVVDTPNQKANTLADEKRLGLRPYVSAYTPLQVPDWSLSSEPKLYGKPKFLRVEYERETARASEQDAPKQEKVSVAYRIDGDGKYIQVQYVSDPEAPQTAGSAKEWRQSGSVQFLLEEVPVTIYDSVSFLKDAAEMQLLLFNFMSAESSALNAQAFQKIFISGEEDSDKAILLNEFAINLLSAGSTVTSIEPGSTSSIESAILRSIDWFFKVAFNQVDGLSHSSKESPSADTRRQMKDEFIALVETTLTKFENVLNSVVRHIALLKGMEPPAADQRITFDKTVTDSDYEVEMTIWGAFADQFKQIPTANKEMLKRQAKRLGLGDMKQIEREIEEAVKKQQERSEASAEMAAQARAQLLNGGAPPDAGEEKPEEEEPVNGDERAEADQ